MDFASFRMSHYQPRITIVEQATKTCSHCQLEIPADARTCSHCSGRQNTVKIWRDSQSADYVVGSSRVPFEGTDPLIGQIIDNAYQILEIIQHGGMSTIYLARQLSLKRLVALKVHHPESHLEKSVRKHFYNEAAAANRLFHPYTVSFFNFGQTESGILYIAMEYIDGVSLEDELKSKLSIPWKHACEIAIKIAQSLKDAHDNLIIHRDVKPDNIMLVPYGRGYENTAIKVIDFGIAKIINLDYKKASLSTTPPLEQYGTPEYMSPERLNGEPVDHRTDIYSLGVVLHQMISGSLPSELNKPVFVMNSPHSQSPDSILGSTTSLKSAPSDLEALVTAMLSEKREDRPENMQIVIDQLKRIIRGKLKKLRGDQTFSKIPNQHVWLEGEPTLSLRQEIINSQ